MKSLTDNSGSKPSQRSTSNFVKKASKDFWDDLSDEDKKSIDRGLADVKANRVKPYKEVMQKIKNRLPQK